MHDLGALGGSFSRAFAINDNGQVTGFSRVSDEINDGVHAFRYDGTPGAGGRMLDLGSLGGFFTQGTGIDSAGNIVGDSDTLTGEQHAFLYVGTPGAGGHMIDLDTWLDAANPAEGSRWSLFSPQGINDSGWITGWGLYDEGQGGILSPFLLDAGSLIPEPHAAAALTSLWCLLARHGRRDRS